MSVWGISVQFAPDAFGFALKVTRLLAEVGDVSCPLFAGRDVWSWHCLLDSRGIHHFAVWACKFLFHEF